MKTESQVRQKLKQVVFRHRKGFLRAHLLRRPENCEHNAVVHLPLHVASRGAVRVCDYVPEEGDWPDRVCDSMLGGERQATNCPHFACRRTADELKAEFNESIGLGSTRVDIGHLAKDYPDAAALMWVLSASLDTDSPNILTMLGDSGGEEDEDV